MGAFIQQAITVGATSSGDVRASYSNYGSCVQIFAPGTNIRSLGYRHDGDTAEESGTSMACPHVTGAAALLLGEDASQTPAQITAKILRASIPNAIRGLTRQCPNKLLSIAGSGEQPIDSLPTSSPRKACPSFAKNPYADDDGDCQCESDASCWSQGTKGCEFSGTSKGSTSANFFLAECKDCTCRKKAVVDSPKFRCNQYAIS